MPVRVAGFLLRAVHRDGDAGALNSAFLRLPGAVRDAGDAQAVEPFEKAAGLRQQLQQRGCEHIARRAHAALQIQRFHGSRFPLYTFFRRGAGAPE